MIRKVLAFATMGMFIGTTALAAESPRKLLAKGNQLFASGRYAEAFDVFKEANAASPNPVFLRSMGYCKLKLSQHKEAYEHFQAYLKRYPKAKDTAKISSTVKDLEVVLATRIKVSSTPPGAELFFDTEAAGRVGTTPFEGTIEPGKHIAILRMAGYETTTRTFDIAPRASVSLEVPLEVVLKISSTPPGATVHLGSRDAKPLGTTPHEGSITPGSHKIFVVLSGYKTFEQDLQVTKGPATVDAQLQLGIRINSVPPGAMVEIDGVRVQGGTPLEVDATPGKHTVTVTLAGFKPFSQQLDVAPGSPNAVEAQLTGGLLTMRTGPDGASVKVGDYELGKTPLERVSVPLGEQPVTVNHPERRAWSRGLAFSDTELLTAEIKLGRPSWPAWVTAGLAVASLAVGIATGVMAGNKEREANDTKLYDTAEGAKNQAALTSGTGRCTADGDPVDGMFYLDGSTVRSSSDGSCSYGVHHASTISFVTAGVSGAFSLLYYWLFVRPSEKIEQRPNTLVTKY